MTFGFETWRTAPHEQRTGQGTMSAGPHARARLPFHLAAPAAQAACL